MESTTHYPLLVFLISFIMLWFSARVGRYIFLKQHKTEKELREDYNIILAGALTLLGVIIGFSFSMAANRYNLRKTYEEAEANAIGTEYVRADLLPAADADKVRTLLKNYLVQRVAYYETRNDPELREISSRTTGLQAELWSAIRAPAEAQPTPVMALAVSGMNDVLNSQSYTQAEFWNRIPPGAWRLMAAIAVGCNLLIGYGSRSDTAGKKLLPFMPLLVSISFMTIADIDSPRHGFVRVKPQNLISLAESLDPNRPATSPAR